MFNLPAVTRLLIIINVLVFLVQGAGGTFVELYFALWPLGSDTAVPGVPVREVDARQHARTVPQDADRARQPGHQQRLVATFSKAFSLIKEEYKRQEDSD